MAKTAWVAGASGLVGGQLMTRLCEHPAYDKVVAFVRQPSTDSWSYHPKAEQWPVDYTHLSIPAGATGVTDLYCALGTTKRKTPNAHEYYQVDVTYPLNFARLGLENGARCYCLVSANGASASSLSAYLKMKGELEDQLNALGFRHLVLARPSLLKGEREEFRLGERLAEKVIRFMPGNLKAIDAGNVAQAMINAANSRQEGCEILSSSEMQSAQAKATV